MTRLNKAAQPPAAPAAEIPLAIPHLSGREAEYLLDCVATNFVSSVGPYVGRFEQAVAASCGSPRAVAVASGTAGLHLALVCAGVRRDDLVVLPSFTFIASANAISHCGATPWLFDIEAASWTLDVALLERALAAETERRQGALVHRASGRRVGAIMPVYTLGTPADMDPLNELARRYALPVVADAAAALGATYRGRALAGLADLSVISFNGNKTVTAGGGGALVGTDAALLARAKHLSEQARSGTEYVHDAVGFNYRMTNVEAAIGLAQMERLDALVEQKRRIRRRYDEAFAGLPGVERFPQPEWAHSGCWLSGVALGAAAPVSSARLRAALRGAGVSAGVFWQPVHSQAPYRDAPRIAQPVAEALWSRIVVLPCSTSLDPDAQQRVIDLVRRQFRA